MTARENFLDKDAMRIMNNFWNMFAHANKKKAFSRWRQNSYHLCVLAKMMAQKKLDDTRRKNEEEKERIQAAKHKRALHTMMQKRLRTANLAFKEMTRFLKALRIK